MPGREGGLVIWVGGEGRGVGTDRMKIMTTTMTIKSPESLTRTSEKLKGPDRTRR